VSALTRNRQIEIEIIFIYCRTRSMVPTRTCPGPARGLDGAQIQGKDNDDEHGKNLAQVVGNISQLFAGLLPYTTCIHCVKLEKHKKTPKA